MKSREHIKSALIVVLTIALFGLAARLWYMRSFALLGASLPRRYEGTLLERVYNMLSLQSEDFNISTDGGRLYFKPALLGAASNGELYAILGDEPAISDAADGLSPLASALIDYGMAGIKKSAAGWLDILRLDGIYIDMGRSLALPVLCGMLGIDSDKNEIPVRHIMIAPDGDKLKAYLKGERGPVYELSAPDAFRALYDVVRQHIFDSANLAGRFALDSYESLEPQAVVAPARVDLPSVKIESAGGFGIDTINGILRAFYYNPYNIKKYERDGAVTYVDRYGTVKIAGSELIEYKSADYREGIAIERLTGRAPTSVSDYVLAACALLARLDTSLTGGDGASLSLWDTEFDARTGRLRLYFEYTAGGLPIRLADGVAGGRYAALIEIRGNYICHALLHPRVFTAGESARVLDFDKALQMAALDSPGTRFSGLNLVFDEKAAVGGEIKPHWVAAKGAG